MADGGLDYVLFRIFGPTLSVSQAARAVLAAFFHPLIFLVAAAATRRPIVAVVGIPIYVGFSIARAFDRPVVPLFSLVLFLLALDERTRRSLAFAAGGTAALGQFLRVSFIDLPRFAHPVWGIDFPKPWEILPLWLRGEKFFVAGVGIGPAIGKRLYLAPVFGLLGVTIAIVLAFRRRSSPFDTLRLVVTSVACLLFFRHVAARYHIAAGNALSGPTFVALLTAIHSSRSTISSSRRRRAAVLILVGRTKTAARNLQFRRELPGEGGLDGWSGKTRSAAKRGCPSARETGD